MSRPTKGKLPLEPALVRIFSRGGAPQLAAVEKELKRMLGWSPARRTLYTYAVKWNSGQFLSQRGVKPTTKRLSVRGMRDKPPTAK